MGQALKPVPVLPDTMPYVAVRQVPGIETKWLVGSATKEGLYLLRVKLTAGAKLPPHTHPDARVTQVLSGTLYVDFGSVFDSTGVVSIPAGAVYVAPAGVPHYAWAREGEVIYQEAGFGPTANVFPGASVPKE